MEEDASSVQMNSQREMRSTTFLQKLITTSPHPGSASTPPKLAAQSLEHGFLEASTSSGSSQSSEAEHSRESVLNGGAWKSDSNSQDPQRQKLSPGDHESDAQNSNRLDSTSRRKGKGQSSSHASAASKFRGNAKSALTHRRPTAWTPLACIILALTCLFAVIALLCALSRRETSARAVDSTKVMPQNESSTSPLLFRRLTVETTLSSEAADDTTRTNSDATFLPDLPAGLATIEQSTQPHIGTQEMPRAPTGVPLIWDTPCGERTVYATKKPLGVQFRAEFPLRVKREPEGHGKEIGVEVGWILKRVNGIDVMAMTDIRRVNEILYREVGEKTVPVEEWNQKAMEEQWIKGIPLIWDTPKGRRVVYATKKPLGVQFRAEFPLTIKREPEGHGKEIGLQVGWVLVEVNGTDVTAMTDINKVNEILYREVGEKTLPVEQWKK